MKAAKKLYAVCKHVRYIPKPSYEKFQESLECNIVL